MSETLSYKYKTDDIYYSHNDVATWPEVLTHNMRVEMIKLGPERFLNKEGPLSQRKKMERNPAERSRSHKVSQ